MARSRRRKKKIRRIKWQLAVGAAAVIVFFASFVYYFANNFMVAEREYAVYSHMEEPYLPIIYVICNGIDINPMHGYIQDMGNSAAGDLITPLNADRSLSIRIEYGVESIAGISYEIRSLDLGHFIENTAIDRFSYDENGNINIDLPIQNMIAEDTPYLLNIKLDLGENTVNYYTRIIWTEDTAIYDMVDTAVDFTTKSFDYEAARDLTMYLETDPSADNSSFATVELSSSFSQITWGSTGMEPDSDLIINIKEYDGIMAAVEIVYTSKAVISGSNEEFYHNTDEYTMRAGTDRIYMMNFQRKTNQIFDGKKYLFAGNRISLGIVNEDEIQTMVSENTRYIAFKSGKELWVYDQQDMKAVNVFSFRSETDMVRAGYDKHDIKILSIDDNGNIDFVVYGYINRGRLEGWNGIIYYRYDSDTDTIREIFSISRTETFEVIKSELDELCVKNSAGMFYLKQNDAVTAIDLTSLEMLNIVSGLSGDNYAISSDETKIAWVEGGNEAGNQIKLMDINTGSPITIQTDGDEILRVIAFYGQDLIYGYSRPEDVWSVNGRDMGYPMNKIEITDMSLETVMSYEREGLYLDGITIEGDRIQITQYRKTDDLGSYQFAGRDTIVSSTSEEDIYRERVTSENSGNKKKVYYISLDGTIRSTRSLDISAPENISFEGARTMELGGNTAVSQNIRYYAYANGRLCGTSYMLNDAIDMIYDDMGYVRDKNSVVVYSRSDRTTTKTLRDPYSLAQYAMPEIEDGFSRDVITESGYIVMNAVGMELNRLLYYVGKGYPAIAYLEDGQYCMIYGYTGTEVMLYYTEDEHTEAMTLEDAALYFERYDNLFVVFRDYPGS